MQLVEQLAMCPQIHWAGFSLNVEEHKLSDRDLEELMKLLNKKQKKREERKKKG